MWYVVQMATVLCYTSNQLMEPPFPLLETAFAWPMECSRSHRVLSLGLTHMLPFLFSKPLLLLPYEQAQPRLLDNRTPLKQRQAITADTS